MTCLQVDSTYNAYFHAGVRLYSGLHNKNIPNFSIIAARDFFDQDLNQDGINDGLWCQSASNASNNESVWYYPTGYVVPNIDTDTEDTWQFPLHVCPAPGQIGLLRDGGLIAFNGLFTCEVSDENGVGQPLTVGVFTNKDYDQMGKPLLNLFSIK